jgi:DNA-directed RNA polymerase subunit E"
MPKEKACKNCKRIYEGDVCPVCDRKETSDTFKGKVEIIDPEKSIIGKELKVNKKGLYAIKV